MMGIDYVRPVRIPKEFDYCLSVANKTALLHGAVTYQNVATLLRSTGLTATPHPTGTSIERFAAMVVQAARQTA